MLLLHRAKAPNFDLYSPIGGKLEQATGESPTACAVREIREEANIDVHPDDLHLTGIISECAYEGETHWLLFLYEVTVQVRVDRVEFEEGRLEWHPIDEIAGLKIPETDRQVIWPTFLEHRGGFFMLHLDCRCDPMTWSLDQSIKPAVSER